MSQAASLGTAPGESPSALISDSGGSWGCARPRSRTGLGPLYPGTVGARGGGGRMGVPSPAGGARAGDAPHPSPAAGPAPRLVPATWRTELVAPPTLLLGLGGDDTLRKGPPAPQGQV